VKPRIRLKFEEKESQMSEGTIVRCPWCGSDPLYVAYHDDEWGMPDHDPRSLWEKLILEGFQSGLSWITILRKRENFRAAFGGFDPQQVAQYGAADVERLLADAGIVRHRGKITGAIASAQAYLRIEAETGFAPFVWSFVDHRPLQGGLSMMSEAVGQTPRSVALSKALKKAGFAFCGPTTVHAFMQAAGLVNDHLASCHRHGPISRLVPPS
jgi:DNA-3-methyladenine glycosylase I